MSVVGSRLTRVDGRDKVTGTAKYSAEFPLPRLAHAVMVMSTVPKGRIASIDTARAQRSSGVIAVLTHGNAPKLAKPDPQVPALQDDQVHYNNQPIAVVVAETLDQAAHAASLVEVRYEVQPPSLDFLAGFPSSYPGTHNGERGDLNFGDVNAGLAEAEVTVDEVYTTPIHHHNPMEPHTTTASWDADRLTLHNSTQYVSGDQQRMSIAFGIPKENVRILAEFVGGGFGSKGHPWSHVFLAALAARHVGRPVKLALERPQMFGPVGARPRTQQHVTLGATRDGKLTGIRHEVHAHTSTLEDYLESSAFPTRVMYSCPNVSTTHRLVPLNLGTPTYTRAPGVATGTFAMEVAMDELAYKMNMDPLQLRLVNYTEVDPHSKNPFTEKHLRECYARASEKFGWSRRDPHPGAMREGDELIGWGMATETYPGHNLQCAALVRLQGDGRVTVESGTQEIGNGSYTLMTQVTADTLALSPELVSARLGDTLLPPAPISAGSRTAASLAPAVKAAAEDARNQLFTLAVGDPQSPLHAAQPSDLKFAEGNVSLLSNPSRSEPARSLLARSGKPIEGKAHTKPQLDGEKYSCHSFGAVFAEVVVNRLIQAVRVRKVVAVFDVGRIINATTARGQFIGGIVWGISLALLEDTHLDERYGRFTNANLSEYHVPVNADIGEIDVEALDIPDLHLDSAGVRGIGEIGITGTGAAVANAIYHATGKRVRDLPITVDKLLR